MIDEENRFITIQSHAVSRGIVGNIRIKGKECIQATSKTVENSKRSPLQKMPKRKRTVSEAKLNGNNSPLTKKRRLFKVPKIINQKQWKSSSPTKNRENKNKWKCIECDTLNPKIYVFCSKCAAEPPFTIKSPQKSCCKSMNKSPSKSAMIGYINNSPNRGFKRIEPLFDVTNFHSNSNNKMDENNDNHNNDNNHNIKGILPGFDKDEYPNHKIQFNHIADESARKYAKYLEKNIRREQNHHIQEFNRYLHELHHHYINDFNQFNKQFAYKIRSIYRDQDTHDMIIKMAINHNNHNNNNNNNNYNNNGNLFNFSVSTPILALCQCQFDSITDINQYFKRAIRGRIEDIGTPQNDYKYRITVIKDKMNILKQYKKNNNNNNNNNNNSNQSSVSVESLLFDFQHCQPNCSWILCCNHLSFYMKQLKHLDIFINATIYQMPYKVFDYLYNGNYEWMKNDANDIEYVRHLEILNNWALNESQQSSIAKALIYPISLIQGPPGTGKTYTLSYLSEYILSNKLKKEEEIIVITAHCHAACDRILETLISDKHNLIGINKERIARFGAINKIGSHLRKYSFKIRIRENEEYKQYTKYKKVGYKEQADECLKKMAKNILMDDIDIVIITCYGCINSLLMQQDIAISHLIIDEATQIVESELLIPMNLLRDTRSGKKGIAHYYSPNEPYSDSLKPFGTTNEWKIDLNDFNKRIIMIGDPKQLSPTVQSSEAIEYGYSISMFERLLGLHSISNIIDTIRKIQREKRKYDTNNNNKEGEQENDFMHIGFNKASDVLRNKTEFKEKEDKIQEMIDEKKENEELHNKLKLQRIDNNSYSDIEKERNLINYTLLNVQYRMKEFMMRFCNDQFYNGSIKTDCKYNDDDDDDDKVINGINWNDRKKSVMLISLDYSSQIRTASGSYHNIDECIYINNIITSVLLNNNGIITRSDIGIIAMHKAQVILMKNVLSQNNCVSIKDIEVNTVDGFQGKEKKLIILSFVRTDNMSTGFLLNSQRCNVALTRAKYGLIVVGQLQQLKANRVWKKFAKFVQKHNICTIIEKKKMSQ